MDKGRLPHFQKSIGLGDMTDYTVTSPHPPEIDAFQRAPLHFYVSEPPGGCTPETVPILVLHGSGELGATSYLESLHKSIVSRRNALVFTVDYLGTKIMRGERSPEFDSWCLRRARENFTRRNVDTRVIDEFRSPADFHRLLHSVRSLPPSLNTPEDPLVFVTTKAQGDHFDFGIVQALDCLWAVAILRSEFPQVDWGSLAVVGQSHGGYLAAMCAKLAPNTFSHVVNVYGWVKPYLQWMLKSYAFVPIYCDGIACAMVMENYWDADPSSPFYLSPDRLLVRTQNDVAQLRQWRDQQLGEGPSLVFTQQIDDEMHPMKDKDDLVEKMRQVGFDLEYLKKEDLQTRYYRSLEQGENTSLKGVVLDFVTPERVCGRRVERSDFDLKSKIVYQGSESRYTFDYADGVPTMHVSAI